MYLVPQEEVIGKKYSTLLGFNATVIAAGLGFGQFDERKVNTYTPSVIKKIQDVIGADWAILKIDGVSNHACLKNAAQTPSENEYSWIIGYPGATKRKIGEVTDNWKKLVSYGKIAYSAEQSGYYKTLEEPNRKISLDFWKVLIDRGEYIITDSDVQGGNSGSPVINDRSELIGLLVQGLIPDQAISFENYTTYSAGVIQLAFIRKSLGKEKFHKYFSCQ
jgi:V8-like Glu-specific endopeptidase